MRRLKGSIQRKGRDRWRVFATVRDADGVSHRLTRSVQGTREDAERVLAELQGQDGSHVGSTVAMMLDAWLAHCEARVRDRDMAESTLDGYRAKVERHIRPGIGRLKCADIDAGAVGRFLDSLESDRRGVWVTLRAALNWGHRNGWLARKVTDRVDAPKPPRPSVRPGEVYTADECAAILNHPMPDWLKTAVVLALSCGLRRGEICGLEWDDYDGSTIEIRRAWGKDVPKTEASEAALSVPQWARDWLDARRGEGHVIVGSKGPVRPDSVTRAWEKVFKAKDAPVRYLPFKNLRHTSLTLVYESTRDLKATSRRGRHSSVAITERFYVRPSRSIDEQCADALDDAIGSLLQ